MNEDFNIEDALRRYRSDPSAHVKQSVLSRFAGTFGSRGSVSNAVSLWKRPIPLYLAASIIIIAAGVSFFAGQRMPPSERQLQVFHESLQEKNTTTTQELTWEVAQSDLL